MSTSSPEKPTGRTDRSAPPPSPLTPGFRHFDFEIGQRIRIVQQVPRLSGTMSTAVEGRVIAFGQSKTGSWFAHSKDKKLWLDRVELQKADGEKVVVNLDQYSHVERLGDA